MNQSKFFILSEISLEKWCNRFNLTPLESNCKSCNTETRATVPFKYKNLRGLTTPKCICGRKNMPFCFTLEDSSTYLNPSLNENPKSKFSQQMADVINLFSPLRCSKDELG
jgi:hypothetical protein